MNPAVHFKNKNGADKAPFLLRALLAMVGLSLLAHFKAFVEFIDLAAGVNDLLLAGEKRVAAGAHFNG